MLRLRCADVGPTSCFGGDRFRRGGFGRGVFGGNCSFLLVGLFGGGPFDFLRQIDAGGGDPFVETFVEFNVVDVECVVVVPLLNREDFCLSGLAILVYRMSMGHVFRIKESQQNVPSL